MPYATPNRYCEEAGFDEARGQLLDDGRVLTVALLRQAMDVAAGGAWDGATTLPERVVAQAAYDRLLRKLTSVSTFMDGYLRGVVELPIAPGDTALQPLEECCIAIARDELASDADVSNELIVKRADRWRKWLEHVSNKTVQLVSSSQQGETYGSGKVVTGQAKSGYDWGNFGVGA